VTYVKYFTIENYPTKYFRVTDLKKYSINVNLECFESNFRTVKTWSVSFGMLVLYVLLSHNHINGPGRNNLVNVSIERLCYYQKVMFPLVSLNFRVWFRKNVIFHNNLRQNLAENNQLLSLKNNSICLENISYQLILFRKSEFWFYKNSIKFFSIIIVIKNSKIYIYVLAVFFCIKILHGNH